MEIMIVIFTKHYILWYIFHFENLPIYYIKAVPHCINSHVLTDTKHALTVEHGGSVVECLSP